MAPNLSESLSALLVLRKSLSALLVRTMTCGGLPMGNICSVLPSHHQTSERKASPTALPCVLQSHY